MAIRTVTIEVKMDIGDAVRDAAILGATVKGIGDETKKTAKATNDFERIMSGSFQKGGNAVKQMQDKSRALEQDIARMRKEFMRTSDANLFGDIQKTERDFNTLQKLIKTAGGKAGILAGNNFMEQFRNRVGILGPFLTPEGALIGAAIVAGLTPMVAAGIAGAVGFGLIGAAAVIQRDNPLLQAAFTRLTTSLQGELSTVTTGLVGPMINALDDIRTHLAGMAPEFRHLFGDIGPAIDLITKGVERFLDDLIPALDQAGKVFVQAFQNKAVQGSFANLSLTIANLFRVIGNNPQLVSDGFIMLNESISLVLGTVNLLIKAVGVLDTALTAVFGDQSNPLNYASAIQDLNTQFASGRINLDQYTKLLKVTADLAGKGESAAQINADTLAIYNRELANGSITQSQFNQMVAALNKLYPPATAGMQQFGAAAVGTEQDFAGLTKVLKETVATADTVAGTMADKIFGAMMTADRAAIKYQQTLADSIKTLKDNRKALRQQGDEFKLNTKAGRANESAVLDLIQSNIDAYDSYVAAGGSASVAAYKYDQNTDALERQLRKAGVLSPAVQKLIDKYKKVPDKVNTAIAIKGLTKAITDLDDTLRLINHIDGRHATASVTLKYSTLGKSIQRWGGLYQHADMGLVNAGIYAPPTRYAFAEPQTGGEAFIPKYGNYDRSMSIIKAAAGWYNAHVIPGGNGGGGGITVVLSASDPQARALLSSMRFAIQQGGGDPVQVLKPR